MLGSLKFIDFFLNNIQLPTDPLVSPSISSSPCGQMQISAIFQVLKKNNLAYSKVQELKVNIVFCLQVKIAQISWGNGRDHALSLKKDPVFILQERTWVCLLSVSRRRRERDALQPSEQTGQKAATAPTCIQDAQCSQSCLRAGRTRRAFPCHEWGCSL